mmetsp:Transcript_41578/g.39973  ORF Transcript_41578/g.39973 Transcript_41578/m.39973 type:complete len:119 (-) Transcript_41578:33-389(-)
MVKASIQSDEVVMGYQDSLKVLYDMANSNGIYRATGQIQEEELKEEDNSFPSTLDQLGGHPLQAYMEKTSNKQAKKHPTPLAYDLFQDPPGSANSKKKKKTKVHSTFKKKKQRDIEAN